MRIKYLDQDVSLVRYIGESVDWFNYLDENPKPEPAPTADEYFTFALINNDTEYNIRAKDTENLPENIVLPHTYNGKPVTEIYSASNSNDAAFRLANIKTVIILKGHKNIGVYAFFGCVSMTSIEIPSSVTSIGNYAFQYCRGLTSIEIPPRVTSIGGYAFNECSGLISVTIPPSVTSIGNWVFAHCTSLTSVVISRTTPPTLGGEVFGDTPATLKIYVPAASVAAYKAASGWSDYASKIFAIGS